MTPHAAATARKKSKTNVLAEQMERSIHVVRGQRVMLDLAEQLIRLAQTVEFLDEQITAIIQVLRQLMEKPPDKPKWRIGFHVSRGRR